MYFYVEMILIGGMSIDYFIAFAVYCTGHQGMNKYLDLKDSGDVKDIKPEPSTSPTPPESNKSE